MLLTKTSQRTSQHPTLQGAMGRPRLSTRMMRKTPKKMNQRKMKKINHQCSLDSSRRKTNLRRRKRMMKKHPRRKRTIMGLQLQVTRKMARNKRNQKCKSSRKKLLHSSLLFPAYKSIGSMMKRQLIHKIRKLHPNIQQRSTRRTTGGFGSFPV